MKEAASPSLVRSSIRVLHHIEDGLLVITLLSMVLLAFSQILMRNLVGTGYTWIDPLLRIMVLWVGLLGALVATRENKHISVDVLTRMLSPRLKLLSRLLTQAFASFVSGTIAWHSGLFVIDEWNYGTVAFASVPAWIPELIIPVGFGIMALRFLLQSLSALLHLLRGTNQ